MTTPRRPEPAAPPPSPTSPPVPTPSTLITTPIPTSIVIPGLFTVANLSGQREWERFCPGVDRRWLFRTPNDGPSAALIRFAPGGRVPLHEHVGSEFILVLAGSQQDENGVTHAGTLIHNPTGTRHRIHSPEGCLVLALYERPVRFLEPLPPLP